jgi:hypothetical protein
VALAVVVHRVAGFIFGDETEAEGPDSGWRKSQLHSLATRCALRGNVGLRLFTLLLRWDCRVPGALAAAPEARMRVLEEACGSRGGWE